MASDYSYEKQFDVVIVGAGVIGCSIAYFLAKKTQGKMKIAVLERNTVGEESSAGAAGMLAAQIETDSAGPFLDLAVESRNSFERVSQELREVSGVDIEYQRSGILSLAMDAVQAESLRRKMEWQKNAGLACEWLLPEKVQELFPFIKQKSAGGLLAPQDGQVSSHRLVAGFAEGAKKMGVSFFENESFDALKLKEPRLHFLETNVSKFIAEKFVFAAGAWTGKLLNQRIQIEPVKGQLLIFQTPSQKNEFQSWDAPLFCGNTPEPDPIHCYFVPKRDRHLYLGATMENRGYDKSENKNATQKLLEYACQLLPQLRDFPFKGAWVGLRPAAPDHMPVLGLVPGYKNVYVASGHFRNGVLLAPITGQIFSELIVEGKSSFSIEPFDPERFLETFPSN